MSLTNDNRDFEALLQYLIEDSRLEVVMNLAGGSKLLHQCRGQCETS